MPPNQLNGITSLTPGTVFIFCMCAIGMTNPSERAGRETRRKGLDSSPPRSNSVRIVAKLMMRKSETTRLEIVSRVRLLFRRMFLKINLANFIAIHPFLRTGAVGFPLRLALNTLGSYDTFNHSGVQVKTRISCTK